MDGILLVDKPSGISSYDVIRHIKRQFPGKTAPKLGHAGTLDPFATGLLIVLVGKGTKLSQCFLGAKKSYRALAKFGSKTDSGDLTGEIVEEGPVPRGFVVEELNHVFESWQNRSHLQLPPLYSAKKIQGKKLYEYARSGQEVERKACEIFIEYLKVNSAYLSEGSHYLDFETRVSAGTYIRTLAEDMAARLGTLAHLVELRRIGSGDLHVENSSQLAQIQGPDLTHLKGWRSSSSLVLPI